MTTFAQVKAGRVLAHFTKDCTRAEAKSLFPDIAAELHAAPADVQDGWQYDGVTFAPYVPGAEEQRQAEIDAAITADSRIAQLKAMTHAQLSSWWAGLTTGQRNDVLFLLVKVILRRVL